MSISPACGNTEVNRVAALALSHRLRFSVCAVTYINKTRTSVFDIPAPRIARVRSAPHRPVPASGPKMRSHNEALSWFTPHATRPKNLQPKDYSVNINLSIGPLISLMAGILILMVPRLLNYIVAIYLIAMGLLGLLGSGHLSLH